MKVLKSEGLAVVNHYRRVNDDGVKMIVNTLSIDNPQITITIMIFYSVIFLQKRKGNEYITQMTIFT